MVVPLIVGAVTKKAVWSSTSAAARKPRHRKQSHIVQRRRGRINPPPVQPTQGVQGPLRQQEQQPQEESEQTSAVEKVGLVFDALKTVWYVSLIMICQLVFSILAFDAFALEDKWYGFAIPAYTVGVIFYILSTLFSVSSIAMSGFFMRKYFTNTNILVAFMISCSGAIALPLVPWPSLWIGYTVLSGVFKK